MHNSVFVCENQSSSYTKAWDWPCIFDVSFHDQSQHLINHNFLSSTTFDRSQFSNSCSLTWKSFNFVQLCVCSWHSLLTSKCATWKRIEHTKNFLHCQDKNAQSFINNSFQYHLFCEILRSGRCVYVFTEGCAWVSLNFETYPSAYWLNHREWPW